MHLPFADDSFDVTVSTFGVCFLPGKAAAGELLRVAQPGGRIVITSWPQAGSILSARSILRHAVAEAEGRPSFVSSATAWHDRGTVRDLFAPHSVEFYDEQILFAAASPQAVAAQYYDGHPQWLKAGQVVGETVYRQLQERAARFFDEINEHTSAWRATDRYLAAVATLDSEPSGGSCKFAPR
jgi:ubiquinone/menaquinone biosynthesis C-methylase UbiE